MRVEVLEYGDNPEDEYPEDFNSFKIMTVWSEPDIKVEGEGVPIEYEDLEEKDGSKAEKRLVTAVEFHIHEGGYLFIERPEPTPGWMNKVFELLREEDWQGHAFKEIRVGCRRDIEIEKGENYTAVIDHKNETVYHNRGVPQGSGKKVDLEEWGRQNQN